MVLVETQFDALKTWRFTVAGEQPTSLSFVDGVQPWPGGALLNVAPYLVFRDVPQVYVPDPAHPEATYSQVRTVGTSLVLGAPWDRTYDHSAGVNDAPKMFGRAPDGPFAVATTARVIKGGIGPAAAGGAVGTVMWGEVSSASISEVVIPDRLANSRHDAVPWRVAFVVATADAATVGDADLVRLDTLRRYYEAAAPIVSDNTLTVRTDLGWQSWPPVLAGMFDPGTPVAVVSDQPGFIDLFAVGQDGRVWTAWFHPPQGWQGWQPVLNGTFAQLTPVAAVNTRPGQVDLFAVGQDGRVWTAWFASPVFSAPTTPRWQGWSPIGDEHFTVATGVAAVTSRLGQIDLFAVGRVPGQVRTAWFQPRE
jgi:hypothetical protein